MNLHRMKYEISTRLLLCTFVFDVVSSELIKLPVADTQIQLVRDDFTLTCKDNSSKPITWTGPKGHLGPKTNPKVVVSKLGTRLEFSPVMKKHAGVYTCSTDTERKKVNLRVEEPITFKDPKSDIAVEGEDGQKNLILGCEVTGGNVSWSFEGGETIYSNGKYDILADGLSIKNVNRNDTGTYTCRAIQGSTGATDERHINLTVKHRPYFKQPTYAKQEVKYAFINSTVNLTCPMSSYPPPKFQWIKKGEKNKQPNENIGRVLNVSSEESVLQLYVEPSSFGNYQCTGSNEKGKLQKHFDLREGFKPLPPNSVELKASHSDMLELDIKSVETETKKPGLEIEGFDVLYRPRDSNDWLNQTFNITSSGSSYPLTNLSPKTDYEIKVASRNSAGLSDWTEVITFSTPNSSLTNVPQFVNVFVLLFVIIVNHL